MATQIKRHGTAAEIAAHISEHYFTISERAVRRDWRYRYGLKFIIVAGKSVAPISDAEQIAKQLLREGPTAPGMFKGRAA